VSFDLKKENGRKPGTQFWYAEFIRISLHTTRINRQASSTVRKSGRHYKQTIVSQSVRQTVGYRRAGKTTYRHVGGREFRRLGAGLIVYLGKLEGRQVNRRKTGR
jgi:hypothetical protein